MTTCFGFDGARRHRTARAMIGMYMDEERTLRADERRAASMMLFGYDLHEHTEHDAAGCVFSRERPGAFWRGRVGGGR